MVLRRVVAMKEALIQQVINDDRETLAASRIDLLGAVRTDPEPVQIHS